MSWLETINVIRTDISASPLQWLLSELVATHPQLGHLRPAVDVMVTRARTLDRIVVRMFRIHTEMATGRPLYPERDLLIRYQINRRSYHRHGAVQNSITTTWTEMTGIPMFMVFATYETMRPQIVQGLEYDPRDTNKSPVVVAAQNIVDIMEELYWKGVNPT